MSIELNTFIKHRQRLLETSSGCVPIDTYGFARPDADGRVDIMFTALTHGNEVIGLEIFNIFLQKLALHNTNLHYGFLLNNVEAFNQNKRLLQYDLNRCFGESELMHGEWVRAREIQHILTRLRPRLLLDLHQTSEASKGAFALIPEDPELIEITRNIASKYPIITFPLGGFSREGKVLTEYARESGVPAIVYEIGQKGFNSELAHEFSELLLTLDLRVLNPNMRNSDEKTRYFHIEQRVPNDGSLKLIENLSNLELVQKGQILATNESGLEYRCKDEALVVFPRYSNIRSEEPDLALLAKEKWVT